MAKFELTTTRRASATVVAVAGELDIATAPLLADRLAAVRAADPAGAIMVDLSGTEFVDSTGVRTLAHASRERAGFALVCPSDNLAVTRVLELTGFNEVLTVHDSLADAGLAGG
jgi:anti-sigma B factor antagonist